MTEQKISLIKESLIIITSIFLVTILFKPYEGLVEYLGTVLVYVLIGLFISNFFVKYSNISFVSNHKTVVRVLVANLCIMFPLLFVVVILAVTIGEIVKKIRKKAPER